MDVARHVVNTYFKDTLNPLVRHHLDSFSDLLSIKIPRYIQASNPIQLGIEDGRDIFVYIGGKEGKDIRYTPYCDEFGNAILPHQCRLENKTYQLEIRVDVDVEYHFGDDIETRRFENIRLGNIPLMLKSSLCYLRSMTPDELLTAGECQFELGGYFVIGGQERVLLTLEGLSSNMFYAKKRVQLKTTEEVRTRVEKESAPKIEGATQGEQYEYTCGISSTSEDGTKGPYKHFLVIPPKSAEITDPKIIAKTQDFSQFTTNRLATIQLPNFDKPVPVISVFYALGFTNDQDIYDVVLAGVPLEERSPYDTLFAELILSHEKYLEQLKQKEEYREEDGNMISLKLQTKTSSKAQVYNNLVVHLFPHCEHEESIPSLFRRKGYLLGTMLRMAMEVAIGIKPDSDRDHFRYKRLDASGDLCFQQFRKTYKEVSKEFKRLLDSRIEFQRQTYAGRKLVNLIEPENLYAFWKQYMFMEEFEKSFKGMWMGKINGLSQVLLRSSYLGSIYHLRKCSLSIDKNTKQVLPRRIHGSSWGLMCPIDDSNNVGLDKALTTFCTISTQSSSSAIKELVYSQSRFVKLSNIHPTTWNPSWTKVYLNSDLLGITEDTETFHSALLTERRSGKLDKFVSLTWNRTDNEYIICSDAGRPMRTIYREGTKPENLKSSKNWSQMLSYMDYIDAQEAESLRISMESFHPTKPSEIHGITILSANAGVNPNSDHNQAPRNIFGCQQTRHACSWYNTAFHKRFDILGAHLHYPQRPLSQTWTYPHILGGNGCMPYGENCIVAIGIFTGYNQDDSILLNDSALKRGLFSTTYYHSYDIQEEAINSAYSAGKETVLSSTLFANIAENPKYRETVSRKEGKEYGMLDGDGVIRVNSKVTPDTILVGIVTPIMVGGQVTGYRDISETPKRGQHGIVDAVYKYKTEQGLQAVKIRIAEYRSPVLGDKFAARHGQKGTCGFRVPEEDMPYTSTGIRPDLIVNPHAFPSRMTIGQFVESMSTKAGITLGGLIDSTPFTTERRILDMKDILVQLGYHPYGHEVFYNGMNGEMIQTELFMGPTYYMRLKQMVEDKINYRTTGPRTLLTHQPLEGRANDGGLRIGEMERDSLLSHGLAGFITESFTKRSDEHEYLFQPETGLLDANPEYPTVKVGIPYSTGLFVHEVESMHIQMKLTS